MLIRKPDQVAPQTMTMPGAVGVTMRVMIGRADGAPHFAMRLFEVAPGGHTPLHQHNFEHEVCILEGRALVVSGSSDGPTVPPPREVCPGDVVFVPANQMHQFRNPGDRPLRFLCLVPVTYDCGAGACQPVPGS